MTADRVPAQGAGQRAADNRRRACDVWLRITGAPSWASVPAKAETEIAAALDAEYARGRAEVRKAWITALAALAGRHNMRWFALELCYAVAEMVRSAQAEGKTNDADKICEVPE